MGLMRLACRGVPLLLLLAGCGYQAPLTRLPLENSSMTNAEKEALARERATEREAVQQGLADSSIINPRRIDELRVQLDERQPDPFSLPPAGSKDAEDTSFPVAGQDNEPHEQFLKPTR